MGGTSFSINNDKTRPSSESSWSFQLLIMTMFRHIISEFGWVRKSRRALLGSTINNYATGLIFVKTCRMWCCSHRLQLEGNVSLGLISVIRYGIWNMIRGSLLDDMRHDAEKELFNHPENSMNSLKKGVFVIIISKNN
eukprot:sb/3474439/